MESVKVRKESRAGKLLKFRLALYDPCEPDDSPEFVGPVFRDTPFDRMAMRAAIATYNRIARRDDLSLCLSPFPWDGE